MAAYLVLKEEEGDSWTVDIPYLAKHPHTMDGSISKLVYESSKQRLENGGKWMGLKEVVICIRNALHLKQCLDGVQNDFF